MKNFGTYQLSLEFYRAINQQMATIPSHLRDQLLRASSSVCLNLAEGWGKRTGKDRKKYFQISFGSLRETQAILELCELGTKETLLADQLAGSIYKLIKHAPD